jgi:hypothetical protein
MFMNFNIQNGALAGVYVIFSYRGVAISSLRLCMQLFSTLEPELSRTYTN